MNRLRILGLGVTGLLAASFVLAAAADAHVTVSAPGAVSGGGDQEITFRVPVEKAANTVGLEIQLPTATPIASVDVEPVAGWTHTQTSAKLAKPIVTDDGNITTAVTTITWKAANGGLKPGEFGAFTIIAGQLPKAKQIVFRALQTYSDGSVVRWVQVAAPGTDEPDFPAPTLELAATSSDTSDATTHAQASTSSSSSSSSDTGPIVLSIIALVLAAAALGLAVVSPRPALHVRAALAAAVLVVLGAAGLVRGYWPQHATVAAAPGQVTVSDAYVVAPVPPTKLAAGYLTITNTTNHSDRLVAIQTGAGSSAVLHVLHGSVMEVESDPTVPAHGRLVLSVGKGHVMIGGLFDTLTPGQHVSMTLEFERAGTIAVTAPVVKVGSR